MKSPGSYLATVATAMGLALALSTAASAAPVVDYSFDVTCNRPLQQNEAFCVFVTNNTCPATSFNHQLLFGVVTTCTTATFTEVTCLNNPIGHTTTAVSNFCCPNCQFGPVSFSTQGLIDEGQTTNIGFCVTTNPACACATAIKCGGGSTYGVPPGGGAAPSTNFLVIDNSRGSLGLFNFAGTGTTLPEPSTLWLLSSLGGLIAVRRRSAG